ncbi:DUF4331 domain-containing protein [bacterium]|nr:DUF4331 domain-containing protein [bacterium]
MKLLRKRLSASIIAGLAMAGSNAVASSHREAPGLANDPAADITDLYTFKGERGDTHQAFVMNVSPAYVPAAAPNWYRFDDDVLYELHIDNNGDAVEDVTYQFQFTTHNDKTSDTNKNVIGFLPAVTWDSSSKKYIQFGDALGSLPLRQTYSVTKVTGGRRKGVATKITPTDMADFPVAPPRVGPGVTDGAVSNSSAQKYTAYKTLADNAVVATAGGYKLFAGPRNDPFSVDLGGVFSAINVRPGVLGLPSGAKDSLANSNVLSIVIEVPVTELIPDSSKPFFGVWATTSRPQGTVRGLKGKNPVNGGGYVQVSRLGNPLVNEAVIGFKDKDKFNATEPKDDAANFASYVTDPQLAVLLNALYGTGGSTVNGGITNISTTGRTDLVTVFVTGIDGISKYPGATGAGDMIRVNRGFAAEAWPLNGRTLTNNVVKTALTFLAECKTLEGTGVTALDGQVDLAAAGFTNHTVANRSAAVPINCLLDSFAGADTPTTGGTGIYDATKFPYVDAPWSAYD